MCTHRAENNIMSNSMALASYPESQPERVKMAQTIPYKLLGHYFRKWRG